MSSGGVTATTYDGNTSGEGNSSCSALGLGSSGSKVDGAYSATVASYRFTVSASKQSLSFAPVAGTTPTVGIVAVIVKGGPAYNVYEYAGTGRVSDAGLTAPVNGGGNIPVISHYVVCYGPVSVPPMTITKKLVGVMTLDAAGNMIDDPTWTGGAVTVPAGQTRWLDYQISYSLPAGVTGTITENEADVCNTMGAADVNHSGSGKITCSFNWGMAIPLVSMVNGVGSWSASGSGSIIVPIDVSTGGLVCGSRTLTNTATLRTSSGATYTGVSTTVINFGNLPSVTCP